MDWLVAVASREEDLSIAQLEPNKRDGFPNNFFMSIRHIFRFSFISSLLSNLLFLNPPFKS